MKCLHVITGLSTGGAEMMLCKLLGGMDRAAVESRVVSLTEGGALRGDLEALGIPVITAGMRRGRLPSAGTFLQLRAMVRAFHPDVVQGWMYHGNLAAQAAAVGTGIPVVWNVRSSICDDGTEKRLTELVIHAGARLSRRAASIIYPSAEAARQHETIGYAAERRVLIPNGFDTSRFAPAPAAGVSLRTTVGLPPGAFVVGHVARYHEMKDHANLLRAAALLRDLPDVHFVLVGRGVTTDNEELAGILGELALDGRVHLLGERRDVAELTAGFTLATNTSAWGEAFPNALGEAMACGVPCVATDVGDSVAIVGDTGIVVPARDPAALAAAWRSLILAPPAERARLGVLARQRVLTEYSLHSVVARYVSLYAGLRDQDGRRSGPRRGAGVTRPSAVLTSSGRATNGPPEPPFSPPSA